eukprot:scaffold6299_cov107-Cylindrotheca_fusiformis.AAC.13
MIREDTNHWGNVVEEKLELHEGAYRGLKETQHQLCDTQYPYCLLAQGGDVAPSLDAFAFVYSS